ncbi:hypothetical protein HMPREF1982_01830 [Clostridiales bacterium oral taxon 876 str. F0540]|nr:hypothetical protein HMPREF1982_01830 [Clostridiales bacterium oral taxon 876 str. F0540]
MEKHEQINIVLGSALLFTIITSICSLPSRLSTVILTSGGLIGGINSFIKNNILWLIVVVIIILLLIVYIKKSNDTSYLHLLQNENIRLTTGVLVIIDGLVNLSSILPIYFTTIQSSYKVSHYVSDGMQALTTKILTIDIITVVIILFQICLGISLVKSYKKR